MSDHLIADKFLTRISALEIGQNRMNAALGLVLDTLQLQTNLLQELCALAREEPEPSTLGRSLGELTYAVTTMSANVDTVVAKLDELPEKIGTEFDRLIREEPNLRIRRLSC